MNGLRRSLPLGAVSEEEAIRKALEVSARPELREAGVWKHEVDTYMAEMLDRKILSKYFAPSRHSVLLAFGRKFAIEHPRQVTTEIAQRWHDELKVEHSPNTARSYVAHVRSFYKWLIENKKTHENPTASVKVNREPTKARILFLEFNAVKKLLLAAEKENMELAYVLHIGFLSGLRKNEVIESRPKWLDLKQNTVHVTTTPTFEPKGRENRTIPMHPLLKKFLRRYLPWLKKEYGENPTFMFRPDQGHGDYMYRTDFKKAYNKFMTSQKLRWCTPHVMRHSFASNLVIKNVSIYKVAKWMGDTVEVTEDHYAHVAPQDSDIERMK